MKLVPWSEVDAGLPSSGRSLHACFDDDTVTVFAAHRPEIGRWALEHQAFGGTGWATDRITRFRLSLPRVMARSQRGQREGKEQVLAITIGRAEFDQILRQAIHWREFPAGLYETKGQWRLATRYAQVVMDWAPDCGPHGEDLHRFTVRFGVHAPMLQRFATEWIRRIEDLGELAAEWERGGNPPCPVMRPYPLPEPALFDRLLWAPIVEA